MYSGLGLEKFSHPPQMVHIKYSLHEAFSFLKKKNVWKCHKILQDGREGPVQSLPNSPKKNKTIFGRE